MDNLVFIRLSVNGLQYFGPFRTRLLVALSAGLLDGLFLDGLESVRGSTEVLLSRRGVPVVSLFNLIALSLTQSFHSSSRRGSPLSPRE